MGLHLAAVLGDEAYIEQLLLLPEVGEGSAEILLIVIPFEAKLLHPPSLTLVNDLCQDAMSNVDCPV